MKKSTWIDFAKKNAGSGICQCAKCGLTFGSTFAFDKHQVHTERQGNKEEYSPKVCLTILNMRKLGMAINSRGHWVSALKKEEEIAC